MVETEVALGRVLRDGSARAAAPGGAGDTEATAPRKRTVLHRAALVVLVLALALTTTLALTARSLHDDNERHLLRQRVNEAGAVLSAAIPTLQTPLSSAAVLADATGADPRAFASLMTPLTKGRPFVTASVWPAQAPSAKPLFVVGAAPELTRRSPSEIRAFLKQATAGKVISVLDLLDQSPRRLGYAFAVGPTARFVIYAEAEFPQNRRATVDTNSAFSDLDYAIYVGATDDTHHLVASSLGEARFTGRVASQRVPFGNTTLDLVMTPRRELGGNLLARLAWLIVAFGVVIAAAAALMTERLVGRRKHAEELARQNALLFGEQRGVAQTLQHSLLPDERPTFPGLDLAVRYVPGVDGVEIGGDWYDVIPVDEDRVLIVVGDVSGRGLRAATEMASLRYSIRAYAAQDDPPEVILRKITKLIDVVRDGHFATVLCGLVNVAESRVTIANAGHPNPLLIDGASATFAPVPVGPPIGVGQTAYTASSVPIRPGAILLAFTDGLFERRGESPDVGLARLRSSAIGHDSLDDLLDNMLSELTPDGGHDDTAILAVRWQK